jgi:hypothetical protein
MNPATRHRLETISSCAGIVPDWPAPANVRAIATTRYMPGASVTPFDRCNLGARSGDDPAVVTRNRAGLVDVLALPSLPVWLQQVHGTTVLRVAQPLVAARAIEVEPQADAAVTHSPGVVLAVLSADCLPVLFAASDGSVVAAAHAGWRGLAAGVLERTVETMSCDSGGIRAWLGLAIGSDHYEVGDEVRSAFVDTHARAIACFRPTRSGHWLCDLYGLARLRLADLGIMSVSGGGESTFGDAGRFYSHRRDGARSGRQATLIWRQDGHDKAG